jgi:hypothetical protein
LAGIVTVKFTSHIEAFRARPSDLIGAAPHAFSGLLGFIAGYSTACDDLRNGPGQPAALLPEGFDVFVRRTINARHPERQYGAGLNMTTIIMSEARGDDRSAFYLFYELWDMFKKETRI